MDPEPRSGRRKLACDCGYVAHGDDDDELVSAVQSHARAAHGMRLPPELILTLITADGGGIEPKAGDGQSGESVAAPRAERVQG